MAVVGSWRRREVYGQHQQEYSWVPTRSQHPPSHTHTPPPPQQRGRPRKKAMLPSSFPRRCPRVALSRPHRAPRQKQKKAAKKKGRYNNPSAEVAAAAYHGSVRVGVVVLLGRENDSRRRHAEGPHAGRHLLPLGHLLCNAPAPPAQTRGLREPRIRGRRAASGPHTGEIDPGK